MVGILLAVWAYVRTRACPFLWLLDRIAVPAVLGGAFVRVGNFMNSEIVGRLSVPCVLAGIFR